MQSSLSGRVLHIGKFYPPFRGGMETYLADLIEEQRKQGLYAIGLVHGQPRADDPSWLHRVPVQAQILYAPLGLGFPFKLRSLIRQFEPDVLHLHMPNNAVFWALLMPMARKIPWVIHWHSDVVRSSIRRLVSVAYALVYEPFERAVLKHAKRVIVTSPHYLAASKALAPWHAKTEVIPLGLTPQAHHYAASNCAAAAPDWQPNALRLFSLGRLTYYKGFETLIEAVAGMPNVQLLIAGAGDMKAELEQLILRTTAAGQEPAVRLLGVVTEEHKHRLLASCDVFCLASRERTEAFGLAVLEAMQHAKPCIVSDLHGSGLPWIVQQAGGLLAEVDTPPSWRTAIGQLQHDAPARARLGQAAQQAAARLFSIEASAHQVAHLYAQIAPDVFFDTPLSERLNIVLARTPQAAAALPSTLQMLRSLDARDTLVVGHAAQRHSVEHAATQAGAICITVPLDISDWHCIQTGIRYALHHRYHSALTLSADSAPTPDGVSALINSHASMDQDTDLLIGVAAAPVQPRFGLIDRLTELLAGLPSHLARAHLRIYQHDAMVIAASREATLQDHDDTGALVLMQQARLRIRQAPVPQQPAPFTTGGQNAGFARLAAVALFRCSNWTVRKPVKSTTTSALNNSALSCRQVDSGAEQRSTRR